MFAIDNEIDSNDNFMDDEIIKKYKNMMNKKHVENINTSITYCEDCNIDIPIEDNKLGCYLCSKCGVKLSNIIDTKLSNADVENTQCGYVTINKFLPESSGAILIKGLSTTSNIRKLHTWTMVCYREKTLNTIYQKIQSICYKHSLPKCVDDTAKIFYYELYYNKIKDEKSVIKRGLNYKSFIAKCVKNACQMYGLYYCDKEISEMCDVDKSDMKRGDKIMKSLCELKNFKIKLKTIQPENYVIRFCEKINMNKYYHQKVLQITRNVRKIKIVNSHNTKSIAVAMIYVTSIIYNLNLNKKEISKIFKTSHVTISEMADKLQPFYNILINDEMCNIIEQKLNFHQNNIIYEEKYNLNCIKHFVSCNHINFNNFTDLMNFHYKANIIINNNIININNIRIKNKLNALLNF